MLKKTITFDDLDDNPVTRDFYFHMSEDDLIQLEQTHEGGLSDLLRIIQSSDDPRVALAEFRKIIAITVGRRSDDNTFFQKTPEISAAFLLSNAFMELMTEFVKDPMEAARFIRGIMPKKLQDKVSLDEIMDRAKPDAQGYSPITTQIVDELSAPKDQEPARPAKRLEEYTNEELFDMEPALLEKIVRNHKGNVPKAVTLLLMQRANQA